MAISVSYYSGSYTYTAAKTTQLTGYNRTASGVTWTLNQSNKPIVVVYKQKGGGYTRVNATNGGYSGGYGSESTGGASNFSISPRIDDGEIGVPYAVYEGYGGRRINRNNDTVGVSFSVARNSGNNSVINITYKYYNDGKEVTNLGNGQTMIFPYTNTSTYSRGTSTTPASASVSVTGLTASGTTVSINSSYSGRVLVSTDGTNYYYSSGTSLPVSLGTSSRTVYVAILSTSGSALGLSNGSRYSKSTLDSKISTYNTNETKNNNANSAASSFDSLYNSISSNINSLTSSNLSTLNGYLSTISSNSSTSDSRYTTRKTKYDTLNNKKSAFDAAITAFDNLNLNTTPNNTTATEAKRQLDIILTNAGSSYEGYTNRLAKYNTYVANLLNISVGSLRELYTNISGTMLPGKVSRYTDIHTRGTEVYNTTKTYIEKLLNRN